MTLKKAIGNLNISENSTDLKFQFSKYSEEASYDYMRVLDVLVHTGQKTSRKEPVIFSRFINTFNKFVTRVTFKV